MNEPPVRRLSAGMLLVQVTVDYAPFGEFQKNRLTNQGLNCWTFEPRDTIGYLSQKNGSILPPASTTENTTTDNYIGQQFHVGVTGPGKAV